MKKNGIILVLALILGLGLTACAAAPAAGTTPTETVASATPLPPPADTANTQAISLEEQVQAAAALTQAAQPNNTLTAQEIQTAIALTQPAVPAPPQDLPPATPVVNTRPVEAVALLTNTEIQDAIAQYKLEEPAQSTSGEVIPAAGAGVSATYTPQPLVLQNLSADQAFSGASVFRWGLLRHKVYMVVLQLSGATSGNFYGMIGKTKYKCFLLPRRPDRLFCYGGNVQGGNREFLVLEEGSNRQLFSAGVVLPEWTPTRLPSPTPLKYREIKP